METIKVFENLIEVFLDNNNIDKNENHLLVFQGFPIEFYTASDNIDLKHFSSSWNGKYIDYKLIDGKILLGDLLKSSGTKWCFYEELTALSEIINDFSIYSGEMIIVKNNLFVDYYPIPVDINTDQALKIFENESTKDVNEKLRSYYADIKLFGNVPLYQYVNKHYSVDIGIQVKEIGFYSDSLSIKNVEIKTESFEVISPVGLIKVKYQLQSGLIKSKSFEIKTNNNSIKAELNLINQLGLYYDVNIAASSGYYSDSEKSGQKYVEILKKYWGEYAEFRDGNFYKNPGISSETTEISQGVIISEIINQVENARINDQYSDIIITAPTGAGKSLFFQIPGIHLHENREALTLVVCPLVALMVDQEKELRDRGVDYATYINSSITYEERQSRLEGIKNGRYSIVYLSPELLLAYDIRNLIGDRTIGLMVIDEAHLVTSWGRDFRVDYWFLGDYIEKIRRGSYYSKASRMSFPILCLTATAVFGGRDDIIGDLQNSLHLTCYPEQMYIGYVRRDNINFNIRRTQKNNKSDKEEKLELTTNAIYSFAQKKEKTIAYFPYKSQIEDVLNNISDNYSGIKNQVEKYYSSEMNSIEKDQAYSNFRDNQSTIMLATKAFGMGINISDVLNVYHYAPTGTLADYVQEIGRAARKLDSGYAITDYLSTDMHYARTLWGLSGLRHYQIKAIMKKLFELYSVNKSRNLLFSPETFSYLFDSREVDTKVKSGLMLLSTDLLEKYLFKVVTVRPKNLFTKQYIIVPYTIEKKFLADYGVFCTRMNDNKTQKELAHGKHPEVTINKIGEVYEIDMASLWETKFDTLTFPYFKYKFFSGELFNFIEEKIIANMKLIITYDREYEYSYDKFMKLSEALQRTFNDLKKEYGGRNFTLSDFVIKFTLHYGEKIRREYLLMLLELFCYSHVNDFEVPSDPWKFIKRGVSDKKGINSDVIYAIRTQKSGGLSTNLQRYIKQSKPNSPDGKQYVTYLTIPKDGASNSYHQLVSSMLQLFDFASYEMVGGRNPQIFVRINDPLKLKRIAESSREYKNNLLVEIEERHKRAVDIMNKFMGVERSNDERWEIIEDYFLGNDDIVDARLGIDRSAKVEVKDKKVKVKKNDLAPDLFDFKPGGEMIEFYNSWEEALEMPYAESLMINDVPMATYISSTIMIDNSAFEANFTWMPQQVALMDSSLTQVQIDNASKQGWQLFNSDEIDISKLIKLLGE